MVSNTPKKTHDIYTLSHHIYMYYTYATDRTYTTYIAYITYVAHTIYNT